MTKLTIGLFEEHNEAKAALKDLANSGFDRKTIEVVESYKSSLDRDLQKQGVPQRDAQAYVSGVKSGDTLLYLLTEDNRSELAREILNRHGALDIYDAHEVRTGSILGTTGSTEVTSAPHTAGMTGTTGTTGTVAATSITSATSAAAGTRGMSGANEVAIPVVEEQLAVGKRQVQRGGALIHTYVTERPVEEQVTLREEHVHVERHPVNRAVTSADTAALQEATFEVTEHAEEAVVAKQARVVEEVVVSKEATERTETIHDTVRRTNVDVDELDNDDDVTTTSSTTTIGTKRP